MITRFKTRSGSTYELNKHNMTWTRVEAAGDRDPFAPLRTESGTLLEFPHVKVGERCVMLGPSLTPLPDGFVGMRYISTSPVTEVLPA